MNKEIYLKAKEIHEENMWQKDLPKTEIKPINPKIELSADWGDEYDAIPDSNPISVKDELKNELTIGERYFIMLTTMEPIDSIDNLTDEEKWEKWNSWLKANYIIFISPELEYLINIKDEHGITPTQSWFQIQCEYLRSLREIIDNEEYEKEHGTGIPYIEWEYQESPYISGEYIPM